jgi:hypothetical protein
MAEIATAEEAYTLWLYRQQRAKELAAKKYYAEAQKHQDRASELERQIAPISSWEEAWSKTSGM